MFQLKKQSYYPSNLTLITLDSYGTRKLFQKPFNKGLKPTQSLSKMPAFARTQKITYDKQSLLQQFKNQKLKNHFLNITNTQIRLNIPKKKIKMEGSESSLLLRQNTKCMNAPFKRQIQHLVAQIQKQNKEISNLKSSKKYNRLIELQTAKEAYLLEIKQMKNKMKSFKNEIKQQRNLQSQRKEMAKQQKLADNVVKQKIGTNNEILKQKISNFCSRIKEASIKQISYRREKKRLVNEINELQTKTGKIYLFYQDNNSELQQQERKDIIGLNNIVEETQNQSNQHQEVQLQSQSSSIDFQSFQEKQAKSQKVPPRKLGRSSSF